MPEEKKEKEPEAPPAEEKESVTKHSVTIGGRKVNYSVSARTTNLRKADGKPAASIFSIAYTRTDVPDQINRPVTFTFNGGPGSSSVWLHLGAFGPRRVAIGDSIVALRPPFVVEDNPYSILDVTDLVFIDPVATGFSKPAPGEEGKQFFGFKEDVEWVGEFIRDWTTRNGRWASPKLLAGESYGTVRASGLSSHLQDRHGLYLNGIILISAILQMQGSSPSLANDLPYVLGLPTLAATAHYHGQVKGFSSVDALVAEVEEFAISEYSHALLRGTQISEKESDEIASKVSRYTGLSKDFILQSNLRVRSGRFFKELMRHERRTVGRLDSRFLGIDQDAAGEHPEYDPTFPVVQGAYTGAFNHYLRSELKFETSDNYEILNGAGVRPWKFDEGEYLDASASLRSAMTRNPGLLILLASGYYDIATPYFAAEHTMNHMALDTSLAGNITTARYEAGHMMYIHDPSADKLRQDIVAFMRKAVTPVSFAASNGAKSQTRVRTKAK